MTTLSQPAETAGSDHPPARSGTPTAWMALGLVALLVAAWMFADQLVCGMIRTGAAAWAWKRGEILRIGRLDFEGSGNLRATDIEWTRGKGEHRSTFRCDMALLSPTPIRDLILPRPGHDRLWIRELWLAKTRLLLDTRGERTGLGAGAPAKNKPFAIPPPLLPGSLYAGPIEAVVIGETGRLAIHDLRVDLPSRWTGRVAFRAAEADLGAGHRVIPSSSARAYWEPGSLRIGSLSLGEGLSLGELTLRLLPGRLDFGLRGTIGRGLIRGDGSLGGKNQLEVTLVGEQLEIDAVTGLIPGASKASGTIDQARLSFRGDFSNPMDADGSVRLVGRNFRWERRGWESLRLAAAMTGRNLTVSELALHQGENELVAECHSSLPSDWHALLRAPFTANFRAKLVDAGSLASLFGPDVSSLGGTLYLDGSVRGADNKAEGYCQFSGLGTRFRGLTVDWIKGCLLFEGATTRIPYAEAAAGPDGISLSGSVDNGSPHAYRGEAEVSVKDLARRLGELGLNASPTIGAGALSGSWKGEGDITAHRGEFRARFTDWVSRWTKGGISGNVEGAYGPGSLNLGKVQMIQDDLSLSLGLTATRQRLDLAGITVAKAGSKKPQATGEISLPLDLMDFWTGGDLFRTLAMDQPMTMKLKAEGLLADQLEDLLGQEKNCTGKLEGWITAGGTPSSPELNGSIAVRGFEPEGSAARRDLTFSMKTAGGQTTATLHQENETETLHAECSLPLRISKNSGGLVPDAAQPLQGSVIARKVPLNGWASLLGITALRSAKSIMIDGGVSISGTVGLPLAQGTLELKADAIPLVGSHPLGNLMLPISFSNATAALCQGTGSYQDQPLGLSGTADWSAREGPPRISLKISGTNLPVELAPGLRAYAKADLNYAWSSSAPGMLGGTLLLDPIRSDLAWRLVPAFCPPGFRTAGDPAPAGQPAQPRLDLNLATATNASPLEGPIVSVNLHLTGTGDDPRAEGSVDAVRQTLRLPAGSFELHHAAVTFSGEGNRLTGTVSGITSAGFGSLQLGGSLEHPMVEIVAEDARTAADWVFACTMTPEPSGTASLQAPAWLRQQMLLPVPPRTWSTSPQAADPSALGFYGTPWIWNLIPAGSGVEQPAR